MHVQISGSLPAAGCPIDSSRVCSESLGDYTADRRCHRERCTAVRRLEVDSLLTLAVSEQALGVTITALTEKKDQDMAPSGDQPEILRTQSFSRRQGTILCVQSARRQIKT